MGITRVTRWVIGVLNLLLQVGALIKNISYGESNGKELGK